MLKFRQSVNLVIIMILMLAIMPAAALGATDEDTSTEALTAPPPVEFSVLSFDNSNVYLDSGTSDIKDNKNQTVSITINTTAKSSVASIGAIVFLQKYTGTEWIDIGAGSSVSGENKMYFSSDVSKSVTKGYYYRARTVHWVNNKGTYEQGESYSKNILVN
ncbi:hypothetical protein E0485_04785 [Paenibacillus albiflavus]|uniref:Uncharacterized protein n=1 Tax=Paenibacillus albiflavus TaxID=2545760 RepID=A0A4R4EP65_9BACL|nr:hypothetical protein [Paenibacillus albiflavus]TCZ80168.1 hypothetical protein E0485_04785 [Paenibacillus albiflavus]